MATKRWLGQAGAVTQIDSIAVAGTWVAADQIDVKIGNSTLSVKIGTGQTATSVVADVIKRAINARNIDENLNSSETRLNAGQLLAEFRDVNATIDPADTTKVLVRGQVAGVPFGTAGGNMTSTTGSAAGTVTRASVVAATGPWHWDNAANWDSGTVPANDDVLVFKNSNVSCKYGLPNGSLEVTVEQWQSFTGDIGLPELNLTNSGAAYYEYREQYVRLDNAGSGTNIQHRFGIGQTGTGSQLINIKHTLRCSVIVYATGQPKVPGGKALNLCCTANTSTLNINGASASVDFSSQDGSTSAFLSVTQSGGDSRGVNGIVAGGVVRLRGGTMLLGGTAAIDVVNVNGGKLRFENQTGTINYCNVHQGGTVEYPSTATITNLSVRGGTFDARVDAGEFVLSNSEIHAQSTFLDPYQRITYDAPLLLYLEPSASLNFGASSAFPAEISI